jgi:hypothetical protein
MSRSIDLDVHKPDVDDDDFVLSNRRRQDQLTLALGVDGAQSATPLVAVDSGNGPLAESILVGSNWFGYINRDAHVSQGNRICEDRCGN